MPKPQTEKTINVIRGKNLVGKADQADINKLIEHIDALEVFLDDARLKNQAWREMNAARVTELSE